MKNHEEVISKEVSFHDAIAERIQVNNKLLQKYLRFDSPGIHIADSIPRLKERLLQELRNVSGLRVLVYGCGNDATALWFAKSGAIVDAIDISPKSVENQKSLAALAGLNINSFVMDAHTLDLDNDQYDIVYGNAILHHLEIKEATEEIYRVLKPGGRGIFRDVMKGNCFLQLFRFVTPFWRTEDEHPLTKEDFAYFNEIFPKTQIDKYMFLGLPYYFFVRMINVLLTKIGFNNRMPVSNSICAVFDKMDFFLFRALPFMMDQSWICLITMTK